MSEKKIDATMPLGKIAMFYINNATFAYSSLEVLQGSPGFTYYGNVFILQNEHW